MEHSEVSAFMQRGRKTLSSIPPRMNILCPFCVVLQTNMTFLLTGDEFVVVVGVVLEVGVVVVVVKIFRKFRVQCHQ